MATDTPYTYPEAPIEVVGQGIQFEPEFNGTGVSICVEVDDSSWAGKSTRDHYVTLSREDWLAVVAHLNA